MSSNPEYKDFNEVTVTLIANNSEYVISNINKQGQPSDQCGCHLQSLTIESPSVGDSNVNAFDQGTQGTITVIDYKDAIFKALTGHLEKYITPDMSTVDQNELCPDVSIEINCFSNKSKCYYGQILDWSMSFTGAIPSLTLTWNSIVPPSKPTENENFTPGKQGAGWWTPTEMFSALEKAYPKDSKIYTIAFDNTTKSLDWNNIRFNQYPDGKPSDTTNKDPVRFTSATIDNSHPYLSSLRYMCTLCHYNGNGAPQPIYGRIEEDSAHKKYYILSTIEPTPKNTDASKEAGEYIFVHNGKMPAYSTYKGKTVIPMTSFSFNTDFKKLALQGSIMKGANGNATNGNANNSTPATASGEQAATSASASNDAITVSFECYNVMPFECNALDAKIEILVFNEFGKEHPTSGQMTVRKVSYSLDGGVIKASVECTSVFNDLVPSGCTGPNIPNAGSSDNADFGVEDESTQSSHAGGTMSLASTNSSSTTNSSQTQQSVQNTTDNSSKTGVAYLRSEDVYITPLSADKTLKLMSNGTFGAHVDTFLKKYGSLTGQSRLLDFSFVKELINTGNFGLLTLLIAVANYGIKDPPSNWQTDAVKRMPEYSKLKNYAASATGKGPYDYKSGGLGIAHWDSGNLDDIYTTVGFPKNMSQSDQNHFSKLLVTSGSVSWKCGSFRGEERIMPVFSKGSKMTLFDKGLKQDNKWKEWAHDILYYKNSSGQAIYQYYLFELWVKKFWKLTLDKLKNKPHACIQDAVRISRAGNSATSMIGKSCGKDVSGQFDVYSYAGREVRYNRQKAYCRRCADIIGWEA